MAVGIGTGTHVESNVGTRTLTANGRLLHVALWVAQVLLVAGFAYPGGLKAFAPAETLRQMMGPDASLPFLRFVGWSEVAGMLGLLLPALTRIRPKLTGWAAVGLFVIMVLATGLHFSRGESIAFTTVLGALAAFVAWGRLVAAPIAPRR